MLAPEARIEESCGRRPFAHSLVSMAGHYIKEALVRGRNLECKVMGSRKCSKCNGLGIVEGGEPTPWLEPCRRCIGTGREEYSIGEAARFAAPTTLGD